MFFYFVIKRRSLDLKKHFWRFENWFVIDKKKASTQSKVALSWHFRAKVIDFSVISANAELWRVRTLDVRKSLDVCCYQQETTTPPLCANYFRVCLMILMTWHFPSRPSLVSPPIERRKVTLKAEKKLVDNYQRLTIKHETEEKKKPARQLASQTKQLAQPAFVDRWLNDACKEQVDKDYWPLFFLSMS